MKRKGIFDTVRRMLGRGFSQSEVNALDRAIDGVKAPCPGRASTRQISESGIQLIKQFEGCARIRSDGLVQAYPDPGTGAEPWTIGWGSTGEGIGPKTIWTQAQCDARLERDLVRYSEEVSAALGGAKTTQSQFDALVSFHYNTGAIGRATLTKRHIAGEFAEAAVEFARWVHAGGRRMAGLARRREAEVALYRS